MMQLQTIFRDCINDYRRMIRLVSVSTQINHHNCLFNRNANLQLIWQLKSNLLFSNYYLLSLLAVNLNVLFVSLANGNNNSL